MLPLGFFKRPAFTGVQLAAFAISASAFALFLYLGLYLQNYLGYTPLQAGLRYLPITLAAFFLFACGGDAPHEVPARILLSAGSRCRARAAADVRDQRRTRSGRRCSADSWSSARALGSSTR